MTAPLAIDLYCGLGGWTTGLLAEGYDVIGFDVDRHVYGSHRYPAQLVLQDVLTLHGSQFREAALIVASPPCQFFSYTSMPWTRAKRLAAEVRADPTRFNAELALFRACFRIQREAIAAAGRHIPLVVENVKGAQPWVGGARWHYGSYYLWGDVPALMPMTRSAKNSGGSWFAIAHNTTSGHSQNPDGRNGVPHRTAGHWTNPAEHEGAKTPGWGADGWFAGNLDHPLRQGHSGSLRRREASALIAKIPLPLARHIARMFRPIELTETA